MMAGQSPAKNKIKNNEVFNFGSRVRHKAVPLD
jgi:hypothetical protein